MEFERRNYPELPQPSGAFHHSVRSGNTLYIAGSTAGGTSAATGVGWLVVALGRRGE